ncbi:FMN-linked oxidoreductase [Artomyces pyxidatus]|uniref:FMN-linked oxidoreductase n=1 Tax=Artomyces pyxidatus TaxID=48021 RepID=A0ACB8SPI0_9AGAM|nr:FMN-linked oxidoreductase [Artomyces pyxidatus]
MVASVSRLFQPITIGDMTLAHRIVMAPLTRFRATDEHVMQPISREYYEQRASAPGTLIVSEGTYPAPQATGYKNSPGIWTEIQIAAWRKIVDAIHARGSFIYLQLFDMGASADLAVLEADGGHPYVGAGDLPHDGRSERPRPMTIEEIHEHTEYFATAARNAVYGAGCDGIEIHSANGYLLDQFLQTNTNNRSDAYGGSIENRVRFPLAVVDAVVRAVGAKRTAVRISPWSRYQGMRMPDPGPTFAQFVRCLRHAHPDLAYLHIVTPRVDEDGESTREPDEGERDDFIRAEWGERPIISSGGFGRESGMEAADKTGDLIAYGRAFIANPDLVRRLKEDAPLNKGDRSKYYSSGPDGYIDYPFLPSPSHP